jgi:predicted transposase/invertase (TIGR01784 family)
MSEHQPYDHALKSLMGDHATEIIPQLLPEAELVSKENIEIKRELLRADLVYLVQYKGKSHILNLELQTNADSDMAFRMLLYKESCNDRTWYLSKTSRLWRLIWIFIMTV